MTKEVKDSGSWSQKLAEQRKLRAKGAELIWERLQLLIGVMQDEEFLAHCESIETNPFAVLDDEVADTCASFAALKATFETFPDKSKWKTTRLDMLVAEAQELRRKNDKDSGERATPSWKQRYLELKAKYEQLEREHEIVLARLDELNRVMGLQERVRQ